MGEPADESAVLDDVTDADILGLSEFLDLLDMRRWVLRRVECITYPEVNRIRRQVSVDVDLRRRRNLLTYSMFRRWDDVIDSDGAGGADADQAAGLLLLPVALVVKVPFTAFDLRDASGESLPVLTSHENQRYTRQLLRGAALFDAVTGAGPSGRRNLDRFDDLFAQVSRFDPTATAPRFGEALIDDLANLGAGPQTLWLAKQALSAFPLIALVPESGPQRRIIKYAAELEDEPQRSPSTAATFLTGRPADAVYQLSDSLTQGSYHVEVHAPAGVTIASVGLLGHTEDDQGDLGPDRPQEPRQEASMPHIAHVVVPGRLEGARLHLGFAPERSLLRSALAVCLGVVLFLAITPPGFLSSDTSSVADAQVVWGMALGLAGASGALAYQGRHRRSREITSWLRGLGISAAALMLVHVLLLTWYPDPSGWWEVGPLAVWLVGLTAALCGFVTSAAAWMRQHWRRRRSGLRLVA